MSALLALTDNAIQAVKRIVESSDGVQEAGGLRMVAERAGAQTTYSLSLAQLPAEEDEVVEEDGARVFLESKAASLLDDKVLDVSIQQDQVTFLIADRAAG